MILILIFFLQQPDNFLTFGYALNLGKKLHNSVKEEMNKTILMVWRGGEWVGNEAKMLGV